MAPFSSLQDDFRGNDFRGEDFMPLGFHTPRSDLLLDHLKPPVFLSFPKSFHCNSTKGSLSFSAVARDCAVGATAGCAAICCCFPVSLVSLFGLAFVKLPRVVFRKIFRSRRRAQKGPSRSPSNVSSHFEVVPITVTWADRRSPSFEPFITARGFGVFADEEYWDELFDFGESELPKIVSSSAQTDLTSISAP